MRDIIEIGFVQSKYHKTRKKTWKQVIDGGGVSRVKCYVYVKSWLVLGVIINFTQNSN